MRHERQVHNGVCVWRQNILRVLLLRRGYRNGMRQKRIEVPIPIMMLVLLVPIDFLTVLFGVDYHFIE